MTVSDAFKQERDALAALGLLAHAYLTWDPPVPAPPDDAGKPDFTHFRGLNIQALVIGNKDGSVLALEKNAIHDTEDPTRHAEVQAMRSALAALRIASPRPSGMSVEQYYRTSLFYAPGQSDAFYEVGCSLFTTLEPCPLCAATLCVARMKRVSYLIRDHKYGGGWQKVKHDFYPKYELAYGAVTIPSNGTLTGEVGRLLVTLQTRVDELRKAGVQDTWFLDHLHRELAGGLSILSAARESDLSTTDPGERRINARTLADLRRLCRLPG